MSEPRDEGAPEQATPVPGHVERRMLEAAMRRMGIAGEAAAVLMVVFGALVLAFPSLMSTLVGLYLILAGATQLVGHLGALRLRNRVGGDSGRGRP